MCIPLSSNLVIIYLLAYEDGTECPERSAYKIQTPGNYPEENIQHTEHGEYVRSARRIRNKLTSHSHVEQSAIKKFSLHDIQCTSKLNKFVVPFTAFSLYMNETELTVSLHMLVRYFWPTRPAELKFLSLLALVVDMYLFNETESLLRS
jgi:hypothetical protein